RNAILIDFARSADHIVRARLLSQTSGDRSADQRYAVGSKEAHQRRVVYRDVDERKRLVGARNHLHHRCKIETKYLRCDHARFGITWKQTVEPPTYGIGGRRVACARLSAWERERERLPVLTHK